jgi:hypothetical protein
MEQWWNDIDRETQEQCERNCTPINSIEHRVSLQRICQNRKCHRPDVSATCCTRVTASELTELFCDLQCSWWTVGRRTHPHVGRSDGVHYRRLCTALVLLHATWLAFELTFPHFHFSALRHVKAQRGSSDCESGFAGTTWCRCLEFSTVRFRSMLFPFCSISHPIFLCFFCTFCGLV